jgi:hypothetical protein
MTVGKKTNQLFLDTGTGSYSIKSGNSSTSGDDILKSDTSPLLKSLQVDLQPPVYTGPNLPNDSDSVELSPDQLPSRTKAKKFTYKQIAEARQSGYDTDAETLKSFTREVLDLCDTDFIDGFKDKFCRSHIYGCPLRGVTYNGYEYHTAIDGSRCLSEKERNFQRRDVQRMVEDIYQHFLETGSRAARDIKPPRTNLQTQASKLGISVEHLNALIKKVNKMEQPYYEAHNRFLSDEASYKQKLANREGTTKTESANLVDLVDLATACCRDKGPKHCAEAVMSLKNVLDQSAPPPVAAPEAKQ